MNAGPNGRRSRSASTLSVNTGTCPAKTSALGVPPVKRKSVYRDRTVKVSATVSPEAAGSPCGTSSVSGPAVPSALSRSLNVPLLSQATPLKESRAFARQYEATGDSTRMTWASVLGSRRPGKFSIQSKARCDEPAPLTPHVLQSCHGLPLATGVVASSRRASSDATTAVTAPAATPAGAHRLRPSERESVSRQTVSTRNTSGSRTTRPEPSTVRPNPRGTRKMATAGKALRRLRAANDASPVAP